VASAFFSKSKESIEKMSNLRVGGGFEGFYWGMNQFQNIILLLKSGY
jgi:hypothetical protein